MLVLTTCTYEGLLYPTWEVARLCEEHGVLFYADEAWAPYLRFHPGYSTMEKTELSSYRRRYGAMDGGAHFAVQSTHKALAAFSQASMIHVSRNFVRVLEEESSAQFRWLRERFNMGGQGSYVRFRHDLLEVLRYWHSTSPHYPMLASLERAGIQMRLEGTELIGERLRWVKAFSSAANKRGGPTIVVGKDEIVPRANASDYRSYLKDPLKLILTFKNAAAGGLFKKALVEARIQWEKSSDGCVEFLVTIGTTWDNVQQLLAVVNKHRRLLGQSSKPTFNNLLAAARLRVLPRHAALCAGEVVEVRKSVGRVAGQMLVPYPPGIPLVLPGLEITKEMVKRVLAVASGAGVHDVHGVLENEGKLYVRVLTEKEVAEGEKGPIARIVKAVAGAGQATARRTPAARPKSGRNGVRKG